MTKSKKPVPKTPLWEGPYSNGPQGGITQSLLGKFLVCRHRFWLKVICGLSQDEGFSKPLEFGNLWHTMEEAYCGYRRSAQKPFSKGGWASKQPATCSPDVWEAALKKHRLHLLKTYPTDVAEIEKWYNVAKVTFPLYVDYWSHHPDEKQRQPLLEEVSFKVPYTLPSGRTINLRGKWDAVCLLPPPKEAAAARLWKKLWPNAKLGIYIQENKTKGKIDEEGLLKSVGWNLQTMMYQIALREAVKQSSENKGGPLSDCIGQAVPGSMSIWEASRKYPMVGVLYNVIKRPLSDQHSIKQRKGGKKLGGGKLSPPETMTQFYSRLAEDIAADPKSNFMRWNVLVQDHEIAKFQHDTFDPIMEGLCDWWESIQNSPFDPWNRYDCKDDKEGFPNPKAGYEKIGTNPLHFQSPFGVYNSMWDGMHGDFFEYLTSGREYGLIQSTSLFPEL